MESTNGMLVTEIQNMGIKLEEAQKNLNESKVTYAQICLCLILLQVPKYFGLVQFFLARPKIDIHFQRAGLKHFEPQQKMIFIQQI